MRRALAEAEEKMSTVAETMNELEREAADAKRKLSEFAAQARDQALAFDREQKQMKEEMKAAATVLALS